MRVLRRLPLIAALTCFAAGNVADASLTILSSVGGAPNAPGVVRDNLDWLSVGAPGAATPDATGGLSPTGLVISFFGNAGAVQGALSGRYAAPVLSGANGAGFGPGGATQAAGADATTYVTTGSAGAVAGSRAEILLPHQALYFGLLWGSVDAYNTLAFYAGDMLVGSLTGSAVTPQATGDQGVQGTVYVNILSDTPFDRVVAISSQYAFEFDNLAFSAGNPEVVPAPAALGLFGISLLGLALARRRR